MCCRLKPLPVSRALTQHTGNFSFKRCVLCRPRGGSLSDGPSMHSVPSSPSTASTRGPPCPVCLSALCHVCADGQEEIKVTAVKQHTRAHGLGQQSGSGRCFHSYSLCSALGHALHRSGRCVLSLSTSRLWHVCGRPIGYRLPIDGTTAHTGHNRGKGRASHPHGPTVGKLETGAPTLTADS